MQSVITSKFQTTIPKRIREEMNLTVKDTIEWMVVDGRIIVIPVKNEFLRFQNSVKTGRGDIQKDIDNARRRRVERFR